MAKRFEILKLDALEKVEKTPEGFLRLPARVTRTGIFIYRKADGSLVKELRPSDEVFNADSLASLLGKPLTNNHPTEGRVDTQNATQHTVGFTSDSVQEDGKFVKLFLNIIDEDTIKAIQSGKQELSCGYTCQVDPTAGEFEGERFDSVQRHIRYNHVALVHRGRAGSEVKLALDSDDAVLEDRIRGDTPNNNTQKDPNPIQKEDKKMELESIKLDDQEVKVVKEDADTLNKHLDTQQKQVISLTQEKNDIKADLDNTELMLDKANGKIKGYKAAIADYEAKADSFDARVKAAALDRAKLQKIAETVLDAEEIEHLDTMESIEIKKAIISKKSNLKLDDASEAHVDSCFEVICNLKESPKENLGSAIVDNRQDDSGNHKEDARERAMARQKNAYKRNGNKEE